MSSNYAFAFTINRRALVPPASQHPQPAPVAASRHAAAPRNATNRFSINRLIHAKSSGGCRSCN